MTRLDHHVMAVRNKLALATLLDTLARVLTVYGGVVLIAVLLDRLFHGRLIPMPKILFWIGLGVSSAGALGYALWRRPTQHQAAVAIDERLALKEKFSTALYIRPSTDPFAAAAVRDAEQTAERVNLQDKFAIRFPSHAGITVAMAVAVLLAAIFVPVRTDSNPTLASAAEQQRQAQTNPEQSLRKALAEIYTAPPEVQQDAQIQTAKREIEALLRKPIAEPAKARATAQKALENVDAVKDKIKNQMQFAQAQNEMKMFRSMPGPSQPDSPVGKAHQELKEGKFTDAIEDLAAAAKNFDKMTAEEKKKNAEAAKVMAQQMQQMANDPKVQQQMQDQLQKLGANQQQAQQMAKAMQQAANGDKKAQQQMQQMANQMMQQMNNGQGPNAQQQQQINAAIQQMQQQANAQQNAANMAQAAQQLAQAMQQQAGQGQPQQQGQNAQQNAQNGNAQGQNAQANAQQKAMQQAIQQMQAQNQAAQAAAAQQNAQAQAGQNGQQPGQNGQQPGAQGQNPGKWGQGQGQFQQGQGQPPQGQGGQGGFAQASGARPAGEVAPYNVQQEVAPSQTDENGKILASSFVKAASERGESKAALQKVLEREFNESTDEVEQDRIPAQAQKSVREYFDAVKNGAAAPAPAPVQ